MYTSHQSCYLLYIFQKFYKMLDFIQPYVIDEFKELILLWLTVLTYFYFKKVILIAALSLVPFSCCQWPVGARAAPWSACFYANAGPREYRELLEPSNISVSLKQGWQIQNDWNVRHGFQKTLWITAISWRVMTFCRGLENGQTKNYKWKKGKNSF